LVLTALKVVIRLPLSAVRAAMMPTATRAAIKPYSMAVAPDSSFTKRVTNFDMLSLLWRALRGPSLGKRSPNPQDPNTMHHEY
jgi:hypothetical protein